MDSSGELVLSGGANGAGVYSISQDRLDQELEARGPVSDTIWAGSNAIVGTKNGVVAVFEAGKLRITFQAHAGEVTALALHPSGDILASVGTDKSYAFYDLLSDRKVLQISTDSGESLLLCGQPYMLTRFMQP